MFKRYGRYLIGAPLFTVGWYFFFVSAHLLLNSEAGITRIALGGSFGLIGVFVGGYIMSPLIAEKIASEVIEKIGPFINAMPGGRRHTDPPAPPEQPPPGIG